jgi:hypothetical protein
MPVIDFGDSNVDNVASGYSDGFGLECRFRGTMTVLGIKYRF